MKTMLAVVLFVGLWSVPALGNWNCGFPPFPPYGCHMVCQCDASGMNCQWVAVCP